MITMCLRHFTHPITGRTGWNVGIDFPDPLVDNIDVSVDGVDEIRRLIADHQPVAIDIREHGGSPAADMADVLEAASDRKRLRSLVVHTDPVWTKKYTITTNEEG